MPEFERYAVYFAPSPESALAEFGRRWLGVDAEDGWIGPVPSPYVESPRRYGFHATLKAPMRLKEMYRYSAFCDGVEAVARMLQATDLGILRQKRIGSFIALVPDPELHQNISDLAWTVVTSLDEYRAPLTDQERAKRPNLTPNQSELMEQWGYPYVGQEFRFHMTLTSSLEPEDLLAAGAMLEQQVPVQRTSLNSIAIFGDPGLAKPFVLLERFDLQD